MAQNKPTKAQRKLVERAAKSPVFVTLCDNGDKIFAFIGGGMVRADLAQRCIESGLLIPVGDGLFGDSQTYIPAP